MNGLRGPVDHDVGQQFIPREDALHVTRAVTPCAKFFNDPGGEAHRGIVQPISQRLRFSTLNMAVPALEVPPSTKFPKVGFGNIVCRRLVQCAAEKKASGNVVEVNPDDALSMVEAEGCRNGRSPIAALGSEALVA